MERKGREADNMKYIVKNDVIELELTDDEIFEIVTKRVLQRHIDAFRRLAQ